MKFDLLRKLHATIVVDGPVLGAAGFPTRLDGRVRRQDAACDCAPRASSRRGIFRVSRRICVSESCGGRSSARLLRSNS